MPEDGDAEPDDRVENFGYLAIVLSVGLGIWLYLFGLLHVYQPESDYHTCTSWRTGSFIDSDAPRLIELDQSLFPPSAVCRWQDGYSLEHVPSYVNPGLIVCGAVSMTAVAATIARRRQR